MSQENYYRIKFSEMPYEIYAYGATAKEAIANGKEELLADAMDTTPLGSATARPAVYGEWKYSASAYTNGGRFLGRDLA